VKVGDLVSWSQGDCNIPGLILDKRPAKSLRTSEAAFESSGFAILAMLPELGNEPEWFHELELEVLNG